MNETWDVEFLPAGRQAAPAEMVPNVVMVSRKIPNSIMARFEKLLEKRIFKEKKL